MLHHNLRTHTTYEPVLFVDLFPFLVWCVQCSAVAGGAYVKYLLELVNTLEHILDETASTHKVMVISLLGSRMKLVIALKLPRLYHL